MTRAPLLPLLAALLLPIVGCERQEHRLSQAADRALLAPGPATRQALARDLVADWHAGKITLDRAIDTAFDRLDAGEDATTFAGAVLDLALGIQDQLPKEPEMAEFLLMRLGRLAFLASQTAVQHRRFDEALELSLAGPKRWQTERYWTRYPDHDALIAVLLAMHGRKSEAYSRINSRALMQEPLQQALDAIRQLP